MTLTSGVVMAVPLSFHGHRGNSRGYPPSSHMIGQEVQCNLCRAQGAVAGRPCYNDARHSKRIAKRVKTMPDQTSLFGSDDSSTQNKTGRAPSPAIQNPSFTEPLASRMRPRILEEIIGQEHLLAPGRVLRPSIEE